MASAQVLPNSTVSAKKQGHLEAGKRRLEEFRRKKAEDRAKKAASVSQLHSASVNENDKQHLDNQSGRLTDSNGTGTFGGVNETIDKPSPVIVDDDSKTTEFVQSNELDSYATHTKLPLSTNYYNTFSTKTVQAPANSQEFSMNSAGMGKMSYSPQKQESNVEFSVPTGASGSNADSIATNQSVASGPYMIWKTDGSYSQPSPYKLEEDHAKNNESHMNDYTSPANSHVIVANVSPEKSDDLLPQNKFGYTSPQASGPTSSNYEDSIDPLTKTGGSSFEVRQDTHDVTGSSNTKTINMLERKLSNSIDHFPGGSSTQLWPSDSGSSAFSFDIGRSSNYVPSYPAAAETNTRRSRPSFLDSINMPKAPLVEGGRAELSSTKVHDIDTLASSGSERSFSHSEIYQPFSKSTGPNVPDAFEYSMASSISAGNGDSIYRHTSNENSMEWKHDSYLRKQDEDFAALEQHIEDLTQEKFSLQRALDASRALTESLAAENSSLTDSYNQQGSLVNQLKSDMENLQAEIKAQLKELESIRMEYTNAQLECNAADERAKLLASEVIGLEEKALRLRSSELKLERQLENAQTEISSFRKKMSSLEKERQDLQSTIDALQEEKKLLQAKLRKASANGKFIDVSKIPSNRKDVSTSTEDLIHEDDTETTTDRSSLEMNNTGPLLGSDASSSSLRHENRQFSLEVSSLNIPPDQMKMIQDINTLIAELAVEKEGMMQALLAESSESSKLKELNKELSRKLEAQTQRLELLTAQSMATENVTTRPPDLRSMHENAPYADEGDEVVERVLGWIMKLFPGGPSRRRSSKLL